MTELTVTAPPARRVSWPAVAAGAVLALLALVGLSLVGELGPFMLASVTVLPFVGLAVLAALGEEQPWARWLAYGYLLLLGLALLGASAFLVFYATTGLPLDALERALARVTRTGVVPPVLGAAYRAMGIYLVIGAGLLALALLPLLRGPRAWLARLLPFNPASVTHTVGLSVVLMLIVLPLVVLLVLRGQPPLLAIIAASGLGSNLGGRSPLLDLIYGFVWLLPCSFVLVGYPVRRSVGAALARLGLVRPTRRQILLGLGLAVALVLAAIPLDAAITWLWAAAGWPRTDTRLLERLMAGVISPVGAVVVGVTAGIGEEVAVRGVLQPRVGLVLANLAFVALHAYQYSFDGLLTVFLIGLVLGVLRRYTNTTTSAITHGVYDFILVLAAALGFG